MVADESFDIEAAITKFLADADADTLELPNMTAGQRKQAKKLAEASRGLTCESFGFGAERRLLLLKSRSPSVATAKSGGVTSAKAPEAEVEVATVAPAADACPPEVGVATVASAADAAADPDAAAPKVAGGVCSRGPAKPKPLGHAGVARFLPCAADASPVRIKNTFIDDWAPLAEGGQENVLFRSMPPQLREPAAESDEPCYVAPVSRDPPALASEASSCATTAVCSTSASDTSLESCNPSEADPSTASKLEPQVRNTFIHFNTAAPVDERVVQSMPHGMFGQALLAAAQEKAQAQAEAAAAAAAAGNADASLSLLSLPTPPPVTAPGGYPLPLPSGPLPAIGHTAPSAIAAASASSHAQQQYAAAQAHAQEAQAHAHAQAHARAHAQAQAAAAAHAAVAAAAAVAGIPPSMVPPPSAPPSVPAPQISSFPPSIAPPPTVAPGFAGTGFIVPGSTVLIEGLSRNPEFNGRLALVQNFDVNLGRYSIVIAMLDGRNLPAKVKRENLIIKA